MLRRVVISFVLICVVATFAMRLAEWWTQAWWFEDVSRISGTNYSALYFQAFAWRAALFVAGALSFGGFLGWQWHIAARVVRHSAAPLDAIANLATRRRLVPLEDKLQLDRFRPFVIGGAIALLAFLAGSYASLNWLHFFRFWHAGAMGEIGTRDPIWKLDLAFYLFRLPAFSLMWGFGTLAIVLAIVLVACLYAYEEVWELGGRRVKLSPSGLRHLSALLAGLLTWNALGHQLSRYNALSEARQTLSGIGAIEWFVRLPVSQVLSVAAVLAALGCWHLGHARRPPNRSGRRMVSILGAYMVASWLLGVIVPAGLQRWWIRPQEAAQEAPFLSHHWQWTRAAYHLDRPSNMAATSSALATKVLWPALEDKQRQNVQNSLDDLPLWPPDAVRAWLAGAAPQHRFSSLHFDRYRIGAQWRPVYVASRQTTGAVATTWRQRHAPSRNSNLFICDARRAAPAGHPLVYHGASWLGLADAPHALNAANSDIVFSSSQNMSSQNMSSRGDFVAPRAATGQGTRRDEIPQSFFNRPISSLLSPANAPLDARKADYLILAQPASTPNIQTPQAPSKYFGGVALGAAWRRWLLALRFGDLNLGLATQLSPQTRLVWHHDVSERCRQLAPFWTWSEPTPVLNDAQRIVWLLDAFSIATTFPYARALEGTPVNFLRASAVATVDAHSGAVQLYLTDDNDPFHDLYRRACPALFRPLHQMPADLRRHLRYPAALLTAQAEIWARFHVGNPTDLLREEARWQVLPADPTAEFFTPLQLPIRFNFSDMPKSPSLKGSSKYFQRAFCTSVLFTRSPATPGTEAARANRTIDDEDKREIVGALLATRDAQIEPLSTWQPTRALALKSMSWIDDSRPASRDRVAPEPSNLRHWHAPLFLTLRGQSVIGTQTQWPRRQPITSIEAGAVAGLSKPELTSGNLPSGLTPNAISQLEERDVATAQQKVGLFEHHRLSTLQIAALPDEAANKAAIDNSASKLPARASVANQRLAAKPRSQSPTRRATASGSPKNRKRNTAVPNTASRSQAPRVLQQARALWRTMQQARQRGDWKTYGEAERALDKVLQP